MNNDKLNYKYNSLMKYIFLPIVIIIIVLNLVFKITEEYLFLIKLICLILNFLIFIMVLIKIEDKKWGALKYIGIGNFFIFIIRFINLELFKHNFNLTQNIINNIIITIIEFINIYLGLLIYRKKHNKVYILKLIHNLILILIIAIGLKYILNLKSYLIKFSLIIAILIVTINSILLEIKKTKENYNNLIRASLLIMLSCILNTISIKISNVLIIAYIINLTYVFFIYSIFEEKLLYFTFLNAYEKLNYVKSKKVNLNRKLSVRKLELKELNLLLRKSQDRYKEVIGTFSDGLLFFENDNLTYFNYYKDIDNFKIIKKGMKISEVLCSLTGKNYLDINNLDYMEESFDIIDKNKRKHFFEFYLFKIDNFKKMLVLNNVTDIIKKRKELIDIENKINKENIKEEFYSNISHELRTPINIIYSAIQLNDIYLKNNTMSKINKNNKIIMQNCLRLIRTINNFIDSNKLNDGYLETNKKYYNLVEIIENLVLLSNIYMKQKNTNLIFDPQEEEIYFYCDKNQIERIMLNILSNSLKYGKDNGNIYIILKIKDKKKIVIEVINDADSIPEEKRKIIFEKFTKLNSTLSRPSEGSGLGLFLTKKLVEIHLGEITLKTGNKKGNIFKIEFPYEKIEEDVIDIIDNLELRALEEKVEIEFSDIYF